MGFSYWDNLVWFVVLPIGFLLVFLVYRRAMPLLNLFFRAEEYQRGQGFIKTLLRLAGLGFAFLAILGPYWGKSDQNVFLLGREIYVLLDVSASMNSEDVKPTRLDKAKKEITKLMESLKGDQFGLIVFTSNAYVQCPITRDYKAFNMFLDLAETGQFAQTGTDLRGALLAALDRFTHTEKRSERISRVVVLVTDGEDFGANYRSILDRYKRNGIQLFVVGVGTAEGAPVPEMVDGKIRGHKHRPDGTVVHSALNQKNMQELSQFFETPFFKLDNPSANLQDLSQAIRSVSASPISARIEKVENSKFYLFVILALICWFGSMFWMPIQSPPPPNNQ